MSQQFVSALRAGADEAFAPDAFLSQLGGEVAVHAPSGDVTGRLRGAEVSYDGREVTLTVEVPDGTIQVPELRVSLQPR